ncbi:cellulase family glycosylhydrolase [Marinilongibacter aquaticus]|uniref:cellulase family glycosylhydrolase n=1 Tax=Marinilongibacter aquaticus TaxID=2975157 RepID=UPI0021BD417E|nr:cellulase family glycosylhydrolase [Marinilongibacter aquaticus]UBM59970.1 cellulase family glycosylhydrolase [Marinilongibacter aquaticus]
MSHLLQAPAGQNGFIRIENGHFVNDAGRVWLNATNLTGSANFPSHPDADLLAERLARFGINCVRLHYMDANYGNFKEEPEQGIFTIDPSTQRNLDPDQMDKFDYMISRFKAKGIYVNINLHVARKMDDRDGFSGSDQRPALDKGVDNFEPRMIELQKEFARDVLLHRNPYTGFTYAQEPAVAMVEINNENALFRQYFIGNIDKLPNPYALELRKQWNDWLHENYKSVDELSRAWSLSKEDLESPFEKREVATIKRDVEYSPSRRDFYKFMYDAEHKYWTGMYAFIKDELGVKPVVSGTQLRYTSPFLQADLDYVDIHAYWCHPSPVNPNWEIGNVSMVNSMHYMYELAGQRIEGKPYTISEYNHPFPNQYGAEGQPMLRAYGRLQGWDGVFQYTYNHRKDFQPQAMTYFFDMIARTDVLAHMPACAAIYLRGDVQEAEEAVVAEVNHMTYFDQLSREKKVTVGIEKAGYAPELALMKRTSIKLTEKPAAVGEADHLEDRIIRSTTGELTWNREIEGAAYWTVNTDNTKLFTGFPEGRDIDLGEISLKIGKTRLGWATVSLVSQNGKGFGKNAYSSKILLTATGLVENKGMEIEQLPKNKIRLSDWGEGPVQAEGIPAKIVFPLPAGKVQCYALDAEGNRKEAVSVKKSKKRGFCEIVIGPEFKTVWYEIETH